jgi:hypothetical protein
MPGERGGDMENGERAESGKWDEKTLRRADFCRDKCTVCKLGRKKGRGLFYLVAKAEAKLKVCPWCRAYEKVYGVPSYLEPPAQ